MSQPPPPADEPRSRRTVLQVVAARTGEAPKVLLPDEDSEHGVSPLVAPGGPDARLVPEGRGNYQVMGEIARGGMGVILKGHDTDLGRDVALKVLDGELSKNPAVVQRFVEEAQIGGQLQHPGIVPVYELGLMADERPYFTMKLIKGRTLSALLQQRKTPAESRGRMLSIFAAVCQTVAYAHSKGVLHRDLKPANIMVGPFGEVMVVDWGLAKVLQRGGVADEQRARHERSMLTVIETVRSGPGSSGSDSLVGSVMGTPAYMAPEQAQGEIEKLDERADVFSLGAILCEILTGRPPYEEGEGEPTVVRAARALLDPARERIAASEADEALKRLCLDCLMPSRAARPRDAEAVASTVHEYLATVEERAHQAELEATTARIQAREERRARKLTVALAGTVLLALVLGGGGYALVKTQREERLARRREAFEQAQSEALELARAGRPAEAVEAARRALLVAETGEVDAVLAERARRFVDEAQRDLEEDRRERALLAQDEALRATLEDLRLRQAATIGNPAREAELDAAFAQAFRDYGVDLEAENILPALERFRARDVAVEVALALDDWGRIRRRVLGARAERALNLSYLAMDLDLDPERLRLRRAILAHDEATLLELAEPARLHELPPGSIWVLSSTLWDGFPARRPEVYRIYDQALLLYPEDFLLQCIGGMIYQRVGRNRDAFACWTAALSLRPEKAEVRWRLAESLFFGGQLTKALGAYRASIALDPSDGAAHYGLGMTLLQLGDHAGAEASIRQALELDGDPSWQADDLCLRFFRDRLRVEDVWAAFERAGNEQDMATYAYALVDHPDPARRAPELALRAMEELQRIVGRDERFWVIDAVIRVEVGDFEGALAAVEGRYEPPTFLVLTPGAIEFLRATIYAGLGRMEAGRESYARGMATWKEITGDEREAWGRSDVMRWRRRAEAALGI